ncbi:MAG: selenoneine synthase SenA [Sulfuriferula sp.]
MTLINSSFRSASPEQLAAALRDTRNYTLALFDCFILAGMDALDRVPYLPIVNPPLWELAHIAWFSELFVLREAPLSNPAAARYPSLLAEGDAWFDSNTVAHRSRWTLSLPSTAVLKNYCHDVFERILDKLMSTANDEAAMYPYRLALAHEDMHGEAFAYTLQTLGVAAPRHLLVQVATAGPQIDIRFPGGTIKLGSNPSRGFVFDNEKWAHPIVVSAFTIDSTLVSNAQYMEFVQDSGYEKTSFWSIPGRAWLAQQERASPRYWQRYAGQWRCERFGMQMALSPSEPVRHVSLYEAQAYCLWARRRLPTEAEWEFASLSGNQTFRWGKLWEWTSSLFEPYPGFAPDAYREYSAPWFKTHQVLRGASFATQPRMRAPTYRNFYLPERNDLFVGFRTCAL